MNARMFAEAAGPFLTGKVSDLRMSREVFMKKLAFVALLGLAAAACTTTEERVGGAAVGAGVGAVAGPVGAVAGGAVGAVTGPTVADTVKSNTRTTRRRQ
jgi:osmotically inducible lipoprotein OsmB